MTTDPSIAPSPPSTSRRPLLFAGVAAAAALAGGGFAWWKTRPDESEAGVQALWALTFDTPGGGQLPMAAFRGKPLVVNFWATWCPPCVDELPLLDGFFRETSPNSWHVVGLAIDQPSAVRAFLARTPVTFPVGLAGLEGSELSRALGNAVGGLPFSVVFDATGRLRARRIGRVTTADLRSWKQLG